MKAAVLLGGGNCAVEETEIAELAPDEVLLELEGCGVCASTLPVWEGRPWFQYPLAGGSPGHEPWGRVIARGESATGLPLGTRVTGLSYRAHAEYDVAKANEVVPIPQEYDGRPFPGEALACAMNVFGRAGIDRGMQVAIVGAGFIGSVLIQAAVAAGARVTVFSKRQWSLDRAIEQGAIDARPLGEPGNEDRSWPCVIECTGLQAGLDAASKLVGIRGRLVVAGYHQEGLRSVDMQEWNWKGIDVINAHEREPARYVSGVHAALESIAQKHLDPWPLITHRVPLHEIDQAFHLMQTRPDGFTKAILCL